MTTLEEFSTQLKAFFKDALLFLTETCEDYSMNGEDDNKRDGLVEGISKLEKLIASLIKHGGSQPQPITDEIYDDTEEPNNNKPQEPEDEYLDPHSVLPNNSDEGIITEETYEDTESPMGAENAGDGGIFEDEYEDPYADGKRKEPPVPPKINEKTKKDKKNKKHKERLESDNRSECSSEDSNIKTIAASELAAQNTFNGVLKKHKAKDSWFKVATRWCAVQENIMYYFESQNSKQQKGAIDLKNYAVTELHDEVKKKKYMFQLACPGKKTYFFSTNQEKEMRDWINYLSNGQLPLPEPELSDIELGTDDETYEVGDPSLMASQGNKSDASKNDEEVEGEMEEVYENPDEEYVSKGKTAETSKPLPPVPSKSEPPPPPKRDVDSNVGGRKPLPPPISDEVYDDAESAPVEDEEFYTDGTSANTTQLPSPTPATFPRQPTVSQPQHNSQKPLLQPPTNNNNQRCSLPPPPENVIKFAAMYYGVWPCQNVGMDELEFNRGDCIEVVNKDKYGGHGWWVGKLGNKVGLVPKSYLSPMYREL